MNRVLVLDDHEPNLLLYAKVIKQIKNAEPTTFTSPTAALRWADVNDPVLVVLDHQMPEMSGIQFIGELRKLRGRADTPVIMITGNSEREVRREALKRGASAFLSKPVDPIEFLAIAANFVSGHATRQEALARAEVLSTQNREIVADLESRDREEVLALVRAMQLRDPLAADHLLRTGAIAERIARRIGLSQLEVEQIGTAAKLHDIGKLGVPERVLQKALKLTGEDLALARKHVDHGFDLLRTHRSPLMRLAGDIAHLHHERFDGTGYPSGLRGEAIPLGARIVAVADTFSAMTMARPWRTAYSVGLALDEIEKESGHAFEPRLVGSLRAVVDELPEAFAEAARAISRR